MHMRNVPRGEKGFPPSAATTLQSLHLGAVEVRHVKARSRADAPESGYRDPGDSLVWAFTLAGSISVLQRKSDFATPVGAMSMSQLSRLQAFRHTPDFSALSIRLDQEAVGLTPTTVSAMSNVAFRGREGLPLVLWSIAREALRNDESLGQSSRAALAESIVDLTAAFADDFLGRHTAPEKERRNLVRHAERFMEMYASNPQLAPEHVAEGVGVSLRVLQKAFQAQGTTITAQLLETRLHRAITLLDRMGKSVTIGHIGERAGFTSPSRFSKAFRDHFGETPRDWRASQPRPSESEADENPST